MSISAIKARKRIFRLNRAFTAAILARRGGKRNADHHGGQRTSPALRDKRAGTAKLAVDGTHHHPGVPRQLSAPRARSGLRPSSRLSGAALDVWRGAGQRASFWTRTECARNRQG